MKKLYYFLLLALPMIMATSCDDDDNDLPDVDISLEISGGVNVDGTIYVVRGETLEITGITVTNRDPNKEAVITSATYYWDYREIGVSVTAPYGGTIATTENTALGDHLLQIECPLFAVDKSPATAVMTYNVVVVESADDIPSGDTNTSFTVRPGIKQA